ncbi:hypothetical protein C8Q73DRAFT_178592 [Cubamyces lactineus]|nr:hypothetical protein C8Q73DRAFT_178592 [Cubamyces lactineus]
MSSRMPIELIEHSIHFLDGDFPTLATCSLVCQGLLPISRSLIWRDVKISMTNQEKSLLFSRARELLALNPDIGRYIRSASFDFQHSVDAPDIAVSFCESFPSLRSLTLCSINSSEIPHLLAAIDILPSLEEFRLNDIGVDHGFTGSIVHEHPDTVLLPRLVKFSVVGGEILGTTYRQMLSTLESSRHSSSLKSLDLRMGLAEEDTNKGPGVPSFAPQLDHFGIVLSDLTEDGAIDVDGRSHMDHVFSELPRAGALRSLCIQYDCLACFFLKEYISAMDVNHVALAASAISPYYLDKLSDLLSSHTPPFPDLEQLSLVFSQPLSWLLDFEAVYQRLAQTILGEFSSGARRYPKFARLEFRFVVVDTVRTLYGDRGLEGALEQFDVDKGRFISMLAEFTQAGVDIDVLMV